jgi:hypothetical protein|nr:MAG TPA_asm: YonK protein [Caudoviricetes sp.]DAL61312.1 MAG TPA_asm: YonK protein [Bacteriophage sp.]
MAKISKSMSFKNFSFRINKDEVLNKDVIYLVEETKDDQLFHSLDEILEYFADEDGLSMTIKIEKNLGEE